LLLQNEVDFVKVKEIAKSKMKAVLFDKFLYRGQTLLIKSEKGTGSTWVCIEIARAILSGSGLFSNYTYCPSNTETIQDLVKQDLVILFEGSTLGCPNLAFLAIFFKSRFGPTKITI